MNFENLTPKQKEHALNAKTTEDVLKLAMEAGYELSDEELDEISGGAWYVTGKDVELYNCPGVLACMLDVCQWHVDE